MIRSPQRDFGTPRRGSERGGVPGRGCLRGPLFGASRSRRNTIQMATAMIPTTTAVSAANPQITHCTAFPSEVAHV